MSKILSDIEIARMARLKPIQEIAQSMGLKEEALEVFGKYKAKLSYETIEELKTKKDGKLILVTSINPTPAGEGKSTVTVGLGDALKQLGKNVVIALREPSLGPVMGIKGGACGGGYAQVVPMEDINLHFTGDLHAISAANNKIAPKTPAIGITQRWSIPTIALARCGTIIPTKPIGPATATEDPANNITKIPIAIFMKPVFKPNPLATSSPIAKIFIFPEMNIEPSQAIVI